MRPLQDEDLRAATPTAPSPVDSLEDERIVRAAATMALETSTDSLEPSYQIVEDEGEASKRDDFGGIPPQMVSSMRDSLENLQVDKDSLLEGASVDMGASQDTHGMLSSSTVGTYQGNEMCFIQRIIRVKC